MNNESACAGKGYGGGAPKKSNTGVKVLAFLLFACFLAGMLVPYYVKIPYELCTGNAFYGESSILLVAIDWIGEVAAGTLAFGDAFGSVNSLIILWLTGFLALTLVLMLVVLASGKGARTAFRLECAAIVIACLGYFRFYVRDYWAIDLVAVAGVLALICYVESVLIDGRHRLFNLLSLAAIAGMIVVFVLLAEPSLSAVAKNALTIVRGNGSTLSETEIAYVVALGLVAVNGGLTAITTSYSKRAGFFTFLRYLVMAVASFIALELTAAETGASLWADTGLCVFCGIAAGLTVLTLFVALSKKETR